MMFTTVTTVWPWIISSICCCLPPAQTEHIIPHIHIIWSSTTIRRIVSGLNGFSTASKAETFVAIVLQPHLPFSRSEAIFLILFTVRMHGFSFSSQVFRPFTFTPLCWVFFFDVFFLDSRPDWSRLTTISLSNSFIASTTLRMKDSIGDAFGLNKLGKSLQMMLTPFARASSNSSSPTTDLRVRALDDST